MITERIDTVVIGAGQAGLAVGFHLPGPGRPFVLLDAHELVGVSWRQRWDSLRLFTPARYDALPGQVEADGKSGLSGSDDDGVDPFGDHRASSGCDIGPKRIRMKLGYARDDESQEAQLPVRGPRGPSGGDPRGGPHRRAGAAHHRGLR